MILVLRVFPVPIDRIVGRGLAGIAFDFIGSGDFSGLIAQIPLVHDVEERRKLVAGLILAVHIVGDRNEMDIMLAEIDFRIKTGL